MNRPFDSEKDVKLIILAGMTRIGTLAAAIALENDYRDLEPTEGNYTLGVVEAKFNKAARGDDRELISYDWVFLEGGR